MREQQQLQKLRARQEKQLTVAINKREATASLLPPLEVIILDTLKSVNSFQGGDAHLCGRENSCRCLRASSSNNISDILQTSLETGRETPSLRSV